MFVLYCTVVAICNQKYLLARCRCTGNACYVHLGVYNYAGLMLLAAIYLMWKMRNVRKQVRTRTLVDVSGSIECCKPKY